MDRDARDIPTKHQDKTRQATKALLYNKKRSLRVRAFRIQASPHALNPSATSPRQQQRKATSHGRLHINCATTFLYVGKHKRPQHPLLYLKAKVRFRRSHGLNMEINGFKFLVTGLACLVRDSCTLLLTLSSRIPAWQLPIVGAEEGNMQQQVHCM